MKLTRHSANGLLLTSAGIVFLILISFMKSDEAVRVGSNERESTAAEGLWAKSTGERTESASPVAVAAATQTVGDNEISVPVEMIQKIGVRTALVSDEKLERTVRVTGTFVMDEKAVRAVSLKVSGWVETLWADYNGKIVKAGEKLLDLYSPELVTTQEEYLLAWRNVQKLSGDSGKARIDAEQLLDAARWRLDYWDMSNEQIGVLETTGIPQRTVTYFAVSSGEVTNKAVSEGEFVAAGKTMMEIVDLSSVWLLVDVHEKDLSWIKPGASARVELISQPGIMHPGNVEFIYNTMDSRMRTAVARIVFPGGHGSLLKPGSYATAYLRGDPQRATPVVPEEAVIRTGNRQIVVKSLGDGRFSFQEVRTGLSSDGRIQVLRGLRVGETVVSSGQFMLDSEARLLGVSVEALN